jgi:hypothetical protein
MGESSPKDMNAWPSRFSKNVFVNCPFDSDYIPLLRPLLFTILYLGYNPRIASERFDSGEQRISKICELIEASKFSIHDLSRIRATRKNEFYRLNMPFELGIDFGCRRFKEGEVKRKRYLVLETAQYRYPRAISDLSGMDIKRHNDSPEELIVQTRNWFVENELGKGPSPAEIWESFNEFMADFYAQREKEKFKEKDLQMMPVPEYVSFAKDWLSQKHV